MERLEKIDEDYLRKLLDAPAKTPKECLYIETGKIPIRFIIQRRRLMYWKHLVSVSQDRLISKFYKTQTNSAAKGDWVVLLEKDKKDFDINLVDDEVKQISKKKFKRYVKEKTKQVAMKYLNQLKERHSKSKNLEFYDFNCKEYLKDRRISQEEAKLMFKLRTRMVSVRCNFKNKYGNNLNCDLCKTNLDNQEHLLVCPVIKNSIPEFKKYKNVKYSDIFGTDDEVVSAAKIFYKITQERERLHELLNISI